MKSPIRLSRPSVLRPSITSMVATLVILAMGTPAIAQSDAQSDAETLSAIANCEALGEAATFTGDGECVMNNGDRYEGAFVDGQRTGTGRYEYAVGGFYTGEFVNGMFNGQGIFEAAQGHRYEGEFANGQFNGQGTYRTTDGNSYTGEFLNNTFHGEGTYTYADGRSLSGIWEAGGYLRALPEEEGDGETTVQDPTEQDPTAQESPESDEETGDDALLEDGEKEELDAIAPQSGLGGNEESSIGSQVRPDALAPALAQ